MERISINEAQKQTSPNPITLICVEESPGITNLAAVSWWTYLSMQPPMLGFALSKEGYSGELIKKNGNLVLSIPGEALVDAAFKCGCVSGRDVQKAEEFGIEMTLEGESKFPVNSKLAFACSLESTADAGDHTFYICKIDDVFFNSNEKQLFSWDGYAKLGTLS